MDQELQDQIDQYETFEEKVLAIIEARLLGRLDSDLQRYSIGSRSLDKIPIEELEKMRTKYQAKVAAIKARRDGAPNPFLKRVRI